MNDTPPYESHQRIILYTRYELNETESFDNTQSDIPIVKDSLVSSYW